MWRPFSHFPAMSPMTVSPHFTQMKSGKPLLVATLLLLPLLLFSAYSNTFEAPLALDDFHSFVDEPLIRIDSFDSDKLIGLGQSKFGWSRWIPMLTFAVDRFVGKGSIGIFHLTNLIIHSLTLLAVIYFVYGLFQSIRITEQSNPESSASNFSSIFLGVIVAGLWALHPLQTNAVTYVVQRMASLVALFTVLSVAFYISARLSFIQNRQFTVKTLIFSILSFSSIIFAFFSKENSAIVPALLICTEIWFYQPNLCRCAFTYFRSRPILTLFLILLVGIPSVMYLPNWVISGYYGRHFTLTERLLTESRILIRYISLVFWPAPARLSLEHDIELSTSIVSPPTTLLSIVFLTILFTWSILNRRRHPIITYGILWFFANLMIESTFVPLELMFEHRMYLPSVGLILSAVVSFQSLARWTIARNGSSDLQLASLCLFLTLASGLALATYSRNTVWEDPLALNRDNALKAPDNPRARANYALALYRSGQYDEAIDEARIAMDIGVPNFEQYAVALNALIGAYSASGDNPKAIEEGEQLLQQAPQHINVVPLPNVYYSLAVLKARQGDLTGAYQSATKGLVLVDRIPHMTNDLRLMGIKLIEDLLGTAADNVDIDGDGVLDPGTLTPRAWVAELLLRMNHRLLARDLLLEAVRANPNDVESKGRLDQIVTEDRLDETQRQKRNFMEKYVQQPYSRFNLCMAISFLIKKHHFASPLLGMGESILKYAEHLEPDSPDLYLLKGWYHYDKSEAEEAVRAAKRALQLDPDHANSWMGLGFFSMRANHPVEAIEAFQKAIQLYPNGPNRGDILAILKSLEEGIASSS
jgi:protein O-mannosyl-transferase